MSALRMALPKGRLLKEMLPILSACGIDTGVFQSDSRRLILRDEKNDIEFILVKPADVPVYVEYGAADMGVAGKDTLLEEDRALYEMLDLGIGACRMCVCGSRKQKQAVTASIRRVATKYPNIARQYYDQKGETVEIIRLSGSIELGPLVGLSDVIVDIVQSGGTLKANGLHVLEEIVDISARVVVNRVSLKTKGARMKKLIADMRAFVQKGSS
ncbi:MAG: ATP phosphoribosyltransferase [Christensenellales bacterium]